MRFYSRLKALVIALPVVVLLAYGTARAQTQGTFPFPYQGTVTAPAQTVPYQGSQTITVTCPSGMPTAVGNVITCPGGGPPPPVSGCPAANPTKIMPSGGNDQPAIWAAAGRGPICLTCPTLTPTCTFQVQQSAQNNSVPSNANIYFDDHTVYTDGVAYTGWAHMFPISGVTNVTLAGSGSPTAAMIQMPLTFAQDNISNNCVWVGTTTNFSITGLRFDKCGEDSIYVGNGSTNGKVLHNVSTNPARNGVSCTDKLTNIEIGWNDLSLAKNLAGGIADGIDCEPNGPGQGQPIPGQFVKTVNIHDNFLHDNSGDGLCLCLYFTNSSTPLDYTLTNNRAVRNGWNDYDPSSFPSPMNVPPKQSGNSWQTGLQSAKKPSKHPTIRLY